MLEVEGRLLFVMQGSVMRFSILKNKDNLKAIDPWNCLGKGITSRPKCR